jgi:phosphate transport system protein
MASELRTDYHRQLEQIDTTVALGLGLVEEAIAAANAAFLSADDEAVKTVAVRRQEIKAIHASLESLVFTQLARQAPVAGELRQLVAVLRILPELDLTAALAGDIARRGAMHFGSELSPRIRGLVSTLFDHATTMWRQVSDAYVERSSAIHERLEAHDEEIDELHASLMAELASGILRAPVLVEMALVARFLERLGDHAVEVARWIHSFTSVEIPKTT